MSNNIKSFIGMGVLLFPLSVFATPTDNPAEISKEAWIEQIKVAASVPICKSFVEDVSISTQMKAHQMTYDKCVSLIPAIAEKCAKKYDPSLPARINDTSAEKWGRVLGECIGKDFATDYLYSDLTDSS